MQNNLGIDKIKDIAHNISEERRSYFSPITPIQERIKSYAEDETYEVKGNYITGCEIAIGDLEFIVRQTVEKGMFEIYAGDSRNGEYGSIIVDSHDNIEVIADFLNSNFDITFYGVKLTSIGSFYKPNNNSKLNQLDDTDTETLVYLLNFLQEHKIIEVHDKDYDGLTDVVIKWNFTKI